MKNYLIGIMKVMLITVVEYSLAYLIIGHPNAILLGVLAMIGVLIPYFGGMLTNVVAAVTAFVISPALFVRTVITFAVLSMVDGYIINPLVYGKSNNVHPLIVIMSVFVGGKLLGIFGIMISFPLAVIILSTIKFFKEDINEKFENIRQS
jgi:predicted PurR-regulated permease PerM